MNTKHTGSVLSVQEELYHSHEAAWEREECYWFADSVIFGKQAFTLPVDEPNTFGKCSFRVFVPEKAENVAVRVVYFTEAFAFDKDSKPINQGKIAPAILSGDMVTADIPEEAFCYYIEFQTVVDGKKLISTTSWITNQDNKSMIL